MCLYALLSHLTACLLLCWRVIPYSTVGSMWEKLMPKKGVCITVRSWYSTVYRPSSSERERGSFQSTGEAPRGSLLRRVAGSARPLHRHAVDCWQGCCPQARRAATHHGLRRRTGRRRPLSGFEFGLPPPLVAQAGLVAPRPRPPRHAPPRPPAAP